MKNVNKPLSTGYYNLLNGIVVDGSVVSFHYLKAPFSTESPYIVITGMYSQSDNTKDSFNGSVTVDLNIYTEFEGDFGTMNSADNIAEAVLELIAPLPGKTALLAEGFTVISAKLRGMRDSVSTSEDKSTYEKKITFEHFIFQI